MPPGEYTTTIKQIGHNWVFSYDLCLFLPVTDTAKYRKSQFYATNHKSHQNVMSLTAYSPQSLWNLAPDGIFKVPRLSQLIIK